jgi:low affinity Fe/Cu permease
MRPLTKAFDGFARVISRGAGHPSTFIVALTVVLVWAATGPAAGFSDTWQLVINTGTTVVTFLMVFLIQHSQNRDTEAMRLKLDELIRAVRTADDRLIAAEDMDDDELMHLRLRYERLAQVARQRQRDNAGDDAAS